MTTGEVIQLNNTNICLNALSENAILITWPERVCPRQHRQITDLEHALIQHLSVDRSHPIIIDTVSAYNSLMIYYDFFQISAQQMLQRCQQQLHELLAKSTESTNHRVKKQSALIEIPVYYGERAGIDLLDCASKLNIAPEEIISQHTQQTFRAYALGFTPGFCYLGQLPSSLQLTRRATPRAKMPVGAVAIAEQQTSVYPSSSPGGWHIIGRTPVAMYQIEQGDDSSVERQFKPLISLGDQVKFNAIDKATYLELGGKFD